MKTLGLFLWLFLLLAAAVRSFAMAPHDVPAPPPPDFVAITSGAWSAGTTWAGGSAPSEGAVVAIPENITVTLTGTSARVRWIQVEGILALNPATNSKLRVDTW